MSLAGPSLHCRPEVAVVAQGQDREAYACSDAKTGSQDAIRGSPMPKTHPNVLEHVSVAVAYYAIPGMKS